MNIVRRAFALLVRKTLSAVTAFGSGWRSVIREPWAGAFQRNLEINADTMFAQPAVWACITQIANDMGKMRPKLVEIDADGIWNETSSPAFSGVLRRPNRYQNHIQFKECWTYSKLRAGNVYGLKVRDDRQIVVAIYILDPTRVTPMVAEDGAIFYSLRADNLASLTLPDGSRDVIVPASEIIHDRINCLFHPLVGISPIYACGLAATKGLKIEENMALFFQNASRPSGVLTAPGTISQDTVNELKAYWQTEFSGVNSGKVAVLGDNLKYEQMTITAEESQVIEQLKWTAEVVCSVFHVPPFKIGIGPMPNTSSAEVLNQIYYSDCLQSHIEQYELSMDDGLGIGAGSPKGDGRVMGVELDLDDLLRMDQAAMMRTLGEGVKGGVMSPNEARRKVNLKPLTGGGTVYLQQQEFSLAALANRDRKAIEDDGASDIQSSAMNGAQVMSLQEIISAVTRGEMEKETAKAVIAAAFPLLSTEQIAAIIDPIQEGSVALPAAPAQLALPAPEDGPDEEAEAREFLEHFTKALAA